MPSPNIQFDCTFPLLLPLPSARILKPGEFSFRNTAAPDEGEKNELLLTWKKRDKQVLRENGWFKLHRQAGLLIWRKSFFYTVSPPNMLYLSDASSHIHTNTHTEYTDLPGDQRLPCCYVDTCRGVL